MACKAGPLDLRLGVALELGDCIGFALNAAHIAVQEPLKLELQHFAQCVRQRQTPIVDGEAAMRALDLAFEITRQIDDRRPAEMAISN